MPWKHIPPRKKLPHGIPFGIDPSQENYYITICCQRRGVNQLAYRRIAEPLFETVDYRNRAGIWYAHVVQLMPDHCHMIISFPDVDKSMMTVMAKWKEWTAKKLNILWQRDFFEHRLRRDESFREKADYILFNPVRAGLTKKPEDWPFVFIADPQRMGNEDGAARRRHQQKGD